MYVNDLDMFQEHACDLCSYRSSRKGNVVQHRKTVHEGKKDFVCGLCTFKVRTERCHALISHSSFIFPRFPVIAKVQSEPARRTRSQGAAADGAPPSSPADKDRTSSSTSSAGPTAADRCASTTATAAGSAPVLANRPATATAAATSFADSVAPVSTTDVAAADPDH